MRSAVTRAWTWTESHPLLADAALAAALLAAALVSSSVTIEALQAGDASYRPPSSTNAVVAGLAAMIVPLTLRRRMPLTVLLVSTTAFVGSAFLLDSIEGAITAVALTLAVYSAAAHGRTRWRNWVCAICLLAVMALVVHDAYASFPPDVPNFELLTFFSLLSNSALVCAMWALGAALGSRRRRAQELLDRTVELKQRTVELEYEREENARRAVFDERVRIARELHDVVAHHVSMMGIQAGAARVVLGRDPVRAREALEGIEVSSRQAVLELHQLLGFLRQADDPDDLAPQPSLGEVHGLAASMSDARLTVAVCVEGEQRPLARTVDVSAYRIVQEALTNTLKHAGASRADVRLRYRPGELELEIVDDGRGDGGRSSTRGGLGLIGMRERAALHGGQLSAGPAAGGGFAVRARLPTPDGAL